MSLPPPQQIAQTEQWVKQKLEFDSSGHDWWHIERVRKLAFTLAQAENADPFIVDMGALLHDICDWKFSPDPSKTVQEIIHFLQSIDVPNAPIDSIIEIISNVSFKGAKCQDQMPSLEGRIVQDADRLDALGAIGIARTFAFGGAHHRPMHTPNAEPTLHSSFEEYQKKHSSSVNHFYEKLFLLKDRMHTNTAKQIAVERDQFMRQFIDQFLQEWDGAK